MGDVFLFEKENRIAGKLLAFRSVIKVWRFNAKTFSLSQLILFTKSLWLSKRLRLFKNNRLSEESQRDE